MTIIRALKTGKRFKRRSYTGWLYVDQNFMIFSATNNIQWYPTIYDILANDWMVQP